MIKMNPLLDELIKKESGHCSYPHVYSLIYGLVREMNPQTLVEIGSCDGRSLIAIAQALEDNGAENAKIYVFDILEVGNETSLFENVEKSGLKRFIDITIGNSVETVPEKLKTIPMLDFTFIDGDHHYEFVSQDFENIYNHTNKGGLILLHDTNWLDGCRQINGEIQAKYRNTVSFISSYREGPANRGVLLLQKTE
jgi:predicted O-methyltransferase YrrM